MIRFFRMQKSLCAILVSVAGASLSLCCLAKGDDPIGSHSVGQSKKYKVFIGNARATPSSFDWRGHKVSFREAWLEHALIRQSDKKHWNNKWNCLCFTLDLDGSPEFGSHTDETLLRFVSDDSDSFRYETIIDPGPVKHLVLGRTGFRPGFVRHLLYFQSDKVPSTISLHVANTQNALPNKPTTIVIEFSLPTVLP